jgi:hypothetical protein
MKRTHILLCLLSIAVVGMACISIGKAMGHTKTLIVFKVPENLVCQPFRTKEDHKAQQAELKKIGAEPVMDQMLYKAFKAQSDGKVELIRVADRVCKEHVGSIESSRATTYYAVNKVTTR